MTVPRENMYEYLEECKKLSLTARAAIALLVFEKFCKKHGIGSLDVEKFSEHLWQWPLIDDPSKFVPWEENRPFLVNYALGDEATPELLSALSSAGVSEDRFRDVTSSATEILWGSFWGAAENEASMRALEAGLRAAELDVLPVLTPFKFSLFAQRGGWGDYITMQDRDFWKECVRYA